MGYLENLIKEAKDFQKARNIRSRNSWYGSTYPPNDMVSTGKGREYWQERANNARNKEDAQFGQLLGALFQGRIYNNKTGKQVKK